MEAKFFAFAGVLVQSFLTIMKLLSTIALLATFTLTPFARAGDTVVYEGKDGPGKGKHIVLLAGDEEYRSEEALPQLGKILSQRHGFKCTLVFSINAKTGEIDPKTTNNQPGIEALGKADLCIIGLRFRNWPDEQMKHFVDYYLAGKPIIGLRTSTHAFSGIPATSPYAKFNTNNKGDWVGGFGRQVLGETWVAHHGAHGKEATRGIIEEAAKEDPILRGVMDIFGPTDVYTANPLAESKILVRGQVLKGMNPTDEPVAGKKNDPMQPIVWTRMHKNEAGTTNKILCTTMGDGVDLTNEGLRRLLVNAAYWATGLEVPAKADVTLVGEFKPTKFGFNGFIKGVKTETHELK